MAKSLPGDDKKVISLERLKASWTDKAICRVSRGNVGEILKRTNSGLLVLSCGAAQLLDGDGKIQFPFA
jgi:hypothetical protein